jgi:predicted MFS family arabinose efflux permease
MGTMARPFLVLFLTERRGFTESQAGLALSFYGAAALVAAPLAGRACDRFGARRIMGLSLLFSGLLLLVVPWVSGYSGIIALIFIWAVIAEGYRPANLALLTGLAPPGQTRAVLALNRVAINLGMSIGPATGGILAAWSYSSVFFVDGAMSILAACVLWFGLRSAVGAPVGKAGAGGAWRDGKLLYALAALIPAMVVFFQLASTLPLFLVRNLHHEPSAYGFLLVVNTVLIILIEVPLNLRMERWPHHRALALGTLLFALGFGGMAIAESNVGLAATTIVWTFGEMIVLPGSAAYVAEIAPPERVGEYMGVYSMAFNVAFTVGPWLGTVVLEKWGPQLLWTATGAVGLLAAAMMLGVRGRITAEAISTANS